MPRLHSTLAVAALAVPLALAHAEPRDAGPALGPAVRATAARPGGPAEAPAPSPREIPIGREVGEAHHRGLKQHAAESREAVGGRETVNDPNAALDPLAASVVNSFSGQPQYWSVPYDAAIAASPTQVLVMTNNQFGVYDKVTGLPLASGLYNEFFGSTAGGGFDPKCFYDPVAGRFVMIVLEMARNPDRALVDVAVSQTADASGAWHRYAFDATLTGATASGTWADFPGLGHDDRHVYLTTNQYAFGGSFRFAKLRAWTKDALYAGGPAPYVDLAPLKHADGSAAFAVKPARHLTPSATGHLLATRPSGGSSVTTWLVTGSFPSLAVSAPATAKVGAYAVGPDAKQPASAVLIDTGDCRTQDVVWSAGRYHTAFTERAGRSKSATTAIRYLEVADGGLTHRDVTYAASGQWLFYPAVTVDPAGNLAMVYERSSTAEYVSVYQTRMPAGGAFEPSLRVRAGVAAHTSGRWGDYNAVANDPLDPSVVWIYGGFGNANNRWASWIASLRPGVAQVAATPLALGTAAELAPAAARDVRVVSDPRAPRPRLAFTLDQSGRVSVEWFDLSGRRVHAAPARTYPAGRHEVEWDATRAGGARAERGVYWARVSTPSGATARRVVVL